MEKPYILMSAPNLVVTSAAYTYCPRSENIYDENKLRPGHSDRFDSTLTFIKEFFS